MSRPFPSPEVHLAPVGRRQLIRDQVFIRLRDDIIDGTLQPLDEIRDIDLQAEYRVSRTPIREAIMKLADLGLVEVSTNRYTRVAPLDVALQIQRAEAARALIAHMMRLAVPMLDADTMSRLRARVDAIRAVPAAESGTLPGLLRWFDFYEEIVDAAGNHVVAAILVDTLRPHLLRSVGDAPTPPPMAAYLQEYAETLMGLVEAGDAERAAACVDRAMLDTVITPMRQFLDLQANAPGSTI